MTVNLRSRRTVVKVGGLDVSPILLSLEATNSEWTGTDGLTKTAGTLALSLASPQWNYTTESLDPRLNPTRWAKGVEITIETEASNGTMIRHPRGSLRILRTPAVPSTGDTRLQISIGCLLTLQDSKNPAGEASGLNPGDSNNLPGLIANGYDRGNAITSMAVRIGLPPLVDAIEEWPIYAPQPQLGDGYMPLLGQTAAAAGYTLWIDGLGQLRATKINFDALPSLSLREADHAQAWQRREGQQNRVDKITIYTVFKKLQTVPPDGPGDVVSVSTTKEYNPSEISTTRFSGFGTREIRSNQTILRAKGIALPNTTQGKSLLITAAIDSKRSIYAEDEAGFKWREIQTLKEPRGKVLPDLFPDQTILIDSKEIRTFYTYDGLVTRKIRTETYEPEGLVVAESQTPELLVISQYEQTEWIKAGDGWIKKESRGDIGDGTTNETVTFSTGGQNQPPAPDRWQPPYKVETVMAEFTEELPGYGPPAYEKANTIPLPNCSTLDQLKWVQSQLGKLVQGQQYPVTWAIDMRPAVLENWKPLQIVEWEEANGMRGRYLTTSGAWVITADQSIVACDGVQLSRITKVPDPNNPGFEIDLILPLWPEVTTIGGTIELIGSWDSYDELATQETVIGGLLELMSSTFEPSIGGILELLGSIEDGGLNYDWIVVDAAGNVVTSGGQVVSTEGDFGAIVVDAAGNVVTSGGQVVSTEGDFSAIVVNAAGNVVTSGGFVVYL